MWGNDFIISSSILIVGIFSSLYIFRKKIFKFYYNDSNFDLFISSITKYLETNHPKIKFDFSIVNKLSSEPNPTARAYAIVDGLIDQFLLAPVDTSSAHKPISQAQLWDSYTFNAKPNGTKLPSDWAKRKVVALQRDNNTCQRCGVSVKPENAHLFLIKSINNGGQFYLENLIIICKDCQKATTNKDLKYLDIRDELNSFIQ